MIHFTTIRRGNRVAVWNAQGDVRFVDGPKRLLLFRERVEHLQRYRADSHEYLRINFLDGRTEHRRGPAELWFDPVDHDSLEIVPVESIDANEAILVYQRQEDERVVRRVLYGPAQYMPQANEWVQRLKSLRRHSAEAHQYLVVRFLDGRTEHLRGPVDLWFRPDEHEAIEVREATPVDAHQALVIYRREEDERVSRRVMRGPAQYVPAANEWLHEFSWHGADPHDPRHKVPRALQFTKLRVIPDQMYFDVEDVRTADDALLTVQLMVFFELEDIDKMMDQTHDPIADFINALSADVIDFAAGRSFEQFKEATNLLNELSEYGNLVHRSERIGYRINKVVYRGYVASDKLQTMHDDAIEKRTALKLEAETERQAQELADLKLEREAEREEIRRGMQREHAEHEQRLLQVQHDGDLARLEADHKLELTHQRELQLADVEHLHGENEERLRFLREIQGLQVDLTRYLVAQYQHPDRLIRVDGTGGNQLHVHEN
ncbi:MAG: hypothetical protein KDA60_18620 [Planctomycetales bacterium]|nr:hypothetical protein [Planctomycetales bacterium]